MNKKRYIGIASQIIPNLMIKNYTKLIGAN